MARALGWRPAGISSRTARFPSVTRLWYGARPKRGKSISHRTPRNVETIVAIMVKTKKTIAAGGTGAGGRPPGGPQPLRMAAGGPLGVGDTAQHDDLVVLDSEGVKIIDRLRRLGGIRKERNQSDRVRRRDSSVQDGLLFDLGCCRNHQAANAPQGGTQSTLLDLPPRDRWHE